MGCVCTQENNQFEAKNEFYQNQNNIEEKFLKDVNLMGSLIKLQAIMKGLYFRKNLTNKEIIQEEPITYQFINTDKIDQNELEELFQKYPPLDDGIEVEVRSPAEFSNNVIYFGEWDKNNDLRHGRGIQVWADGAKFSGCWKNGKACGKGILQHSDGDIYEGDWLDDKPWGYGIYTHLDGTKYEGEWKDDKQHGRGKEVWPDGTSYEGEYVDGKKQGFGIFRWHDKSMYEGQFLNSNIHGKGKYIFADGREYEGDWVNNKLQGKGRFKWPDGRVYTGEYFNDKKDGKGLFEWPDGKKYNGEWKNGKQHGYGEYFNVADKTWKKGYWEFGRRKKWLEEDLNKGNIENDKEKLNESPDKLVSKK